MKSIGFTIATVLIIIILVLGGYLAVSGLADPAGYLPKDEETIGDLHKITTEPQTTVTEPVAVTPTTPAPTTTPASGDLKTNLQTLITNKTVLKVGSKGPAVGYVQTFLNLYFKKSLKVDNDFGKTAEANVKLFQKATGVSQTGQVGPATLGKMVEWLGKNPQ
jgi:peptidoglycan hydrolase-like protein with peptidoglycan-binding domain